MGLPPLPSELEDHRPDALPLQHRPQGPPKTPPRQHPPSPPHPPTPNPSGTPTPQTLYGSSTAASALQSALGNPPLIAGNRLTGFPPSLTVTTTTTVAPYYTVQANDTWTSIAQAD